MIQKKLSSKVFQKVLIGSVSTALLVAIGWTIKAEKPVINTNKAVNKSTIVKRYSLFPFIKALASEVNPSSLQDHRETYLLASDLIKQNKGEQALNQLSGLKNSPGY